MNDLHSQSHRRPLVTFVATSSDPAHQIQHTVGEEVAETPEAVGPLGLLVRIPSLLRGGIPPVAWQARSVLPQLLVK